jgi:hypothetical protein
MGLIMWTLIGKYAIKIALYALQHPDSVKQVVDVVHAAKDAATSTK